MQTITAAADDPDPVATYRTRYLGLMTAAATALRNAARFGGRR